MAGQFSKRKYSILETKKQLLYEIQSRKDKGNGSSQSDSGDGGNVLYLRKHPLHSEVIVSMENKSEF